VEHKEEANEPMTIRPCPSAKAKSPAVISSANGRTTWRSRPKRRGIAWTVKSYFALLVSYRRRCSRTPCAATTATLWCSGEGLAYAPRGESHQVIVAQGSDGLRARAAQTAGSHLARISAGTLPPFSASFRMTCLCSHLFMGPVSFILPV
jgi:hypothetical protein